MDFSKIERLLDPNCYKKREDIGGFQQPQLWRRYASGEVGPIGNGRSEKNAVQLAETICPGSFEVFHSVLWKLPFNNPWDRGQLKLLSDDLSISVQNGLAALVPKACSTWEAIIMMSESGLFKLAELPDIDALAALLIRHKSDCTKTIIANKFQFSTSLESWVRRSIMTTGAAKSVAHLLLPFLEEHDPRFGQYKSLGTK
jgi:hypothetical protein